MRVALVGDEQPAVRAALEAEEGVELIAAPDGLDRDGEIPELATALRTFERLFEQERVERVVLAGSSNLSLAAVLVATKMLIPVGAVAGREGADGSGMNVRLIEHLADAVLADDEQAVEAWLRGPQQPSQAAAEH
jgi:hypothetical protein